MRAGSVVVSVDEFINDRAYTYRRRARFISPSEDCERGWKPAPPWTAMMQSGLTFADGAPCIAWF